MNSNELNGVKVDDIVVQSVGYHNGKFSASKPLGDTVQSSKEVIQGVMLGVEAVNDVVDVVDDTPNPN